MSIDFSKLMVFSDATTTLLEIVNKEETTVLSNFIKLKNLTRTKKKLKLFRKIFDCKFTIIQIITGDDDLIDEVTVAIGRDTDRGYEYYYYLRAEYIIPGYMLFNETPDAYSKDNNNAPAQGAPFWWQNYRKRGVEESYCDICNNHLDYEIAYTYKGNSICEQCYNSIFLPRNYE